MIRRILHVCVLPVVLMILAIMLVHAAVLRDASFAAMQLAATTVIPTLFPFAVLASILTGSGVLTRQNGSITRRITSVFRISPCGVSAWLLGTLCGFPIGAAVISQLYAEGKLQKSEAERMLPWCSNAGPAFVVVIAGKTILGSYTAGWILLAVHEFSALLVALLFRTNSTPVLIKAAYAEPHSVAGIRIFTDAVRSAALTMVQISGFLVLFTSVSALLTAGLSQDSLLSILLRGCMELTGGLYALSAVSEPHRFPIAAVLLGWSGLCVHCQVLSLTLPHGLSAKPYLLGKLLQSLLSLILAVPFTDLLRTVPAAVFPQPAISMFFITALWTLTVTALFFSFWWKFHKSSVIMNSGGDTDAL